MVTLMILHILLIYACKMKTNAFWFPRYAVVCLLLCLPGEAFLMQEPVIKEPDIWAEVLPDSLMDGYVNETDGQFTLICRLLDSYYESRHVSSQDINSTSMYWKYNEEVLDGTHIIDERTLSVTVENITTSMSGKYHCRMNESAIGNSSEEYLITTEINIGNPPEPVTSLKCVSLNWLDMTCYWCPSKPLDPLTRYKLEYQIEAFNDTWSAMQKFDHFCTVCPPYSHTTKCTETKLEFRLTKAMIYRFYIKAKLPDVVSNSGPLDIEASLGIVKPGPVANLNVTTLNSTSLHISWAPNKKMVAIDHYNETIYVVHYKSQWGDEDQMVDVGINKFLVLDTLRPHTKYDIAVRSKTKSSESIPLYWSEWQNATGTTSESNPSTGPPLTASSYKWMSCTPDSQTTGMLQLIWQEIPAIDRNGEITGYQITAYKNNQSHPLVTSASGTEFSNREFEECMDMTSGSYTVEIVAQTAPGLSSPPTVVHVETKLSLPGNIYAEVDTEQKHVGFFFYYKGVADNFTLLRCMPKQLNPTFCETSPVTQTVAGDQNVTIVEDWEIGEVFALGVSKGPLSSGLTPSWIQLCYKDRKPGRPAIEVVAEKERSLTVFWDRVECRTNEQLGVPSSYRVSWTDGSDHFVHIIEKRQESYRHVIENLTPATNYTVSVAAWSTAGYGLNATETHQTKLSAPGGPPQNVQVLESGSDYLTIKCDPPTQPNGDIHAYYMYILGDREKNETTEFSPQDLYRGVNRTGLDGFTNYTVRLQADNRVLGEGGLSDLSAPVHAHTQIGYPTEVRNLRSSVVNQTTVHVVWDEPFPPNGPADKMVYEISSQLGEHKYKNQSRETAIHLTFVKDCGSEPEEVKVWVTALMKEDPQNPLEGPTSGPVAENICDLTNYVLIGGVVAAVVVNTVILAIMFLKLFFYCRKKEREGEEKATIDTSVLMDDKIYKMPEEIPLVPEPVKTLSYRVTNTEPAKKNEQDRDSATGSEVLPHELSSVSSQNSGDSRDSLLQKPSKSQQPTQIAVLMEEKSHGSSNVHQDLEPNIVEEKPEDINSQAQSNLSKNLFSDGYARGEERVAIGDDVLDSNATIMTSAPLTSGSTDRGTNTRDLETTEKTPSSSKSSIPNYLVAGFNSRSTNSQTNSETLPANPPMQLPVFLPANPVEHELQDSDESSISFSDTSDDGAGFLTSNTDSNYVGNPTTHRNSDPESSEESEEAFSESEGHYAETSDPSRTEVIFTQDSQNEQAQSGNSTVYPDEATEMVLCIDPKIHCSSVPGQFVETAETCT